jgi:hypothetical protein
MARDHLFLHMSLLTTIEFSTYNGLQTVSLRRATLTLRLPINVLYIDYIDTRNECAVIDVQVRYNVRVPRPRQR